MCKGWHEEGLAGDAGIGRGKSDSAHTEGGSGIAQDLADDDTVGPHESSLFFQFGKRGLGVLVGSPGGARGHGADEFIGNCRESTGYADLFWLEGGVGFAGEDMDSSDGLARERGQDGDMQRGW